LYVYLRKVRRESNADRGLVGVDHRLEAAMFAVAISRHNPGEVSSRILNHMRTARISERAFVSYWSDEKLTNFERKIMPVAVEVSHASSSHPRFSMFVPELRLATFFGGYYSKIALLARILESGFEVRIILIDQPFLDGGELLDIANAFPELADCLLKAEIICLGNRNQSLSIHNSDVLIATTWWSAHVVNAVRVKMGWERFFYLIQEYEPFTFPLGTFYRAAEQSYEFPHIPIFSTELLVDFFKGRRLGVFQYDARLKRGSDMFVFRNPIVAARSDGPPADRENILLFYARPQETASRNMFDFGLAALRVLAAELGDDVSEWQFIGIGAGTSKRISLAPGANLELIEKLDANAYKELLLRAKVGLALMYTPHPSLIPIEMAAAGLETVTNSCFNKDQKDFAKISSRIIVASPDINGIASALCRAFARARSRPARVREIWPASGGETFSSTWMRQLTGRAGQVVKHQVASRTD
jgi:hypothetical protein